MRKRNNTSSTYSLVIKAKRLLGENKSKFINQSRTMKAGKVVMSRGYEDIASILDKLAKRHKEEK